jgi:hypothetical protein
MKVWSCAYCEAAAKESESGGALFLALRTLTGMSEMRAHQLDTHEGLPYSIVTTDHYAEVGL